MRHWTTVCSAAGLSCSDGDWGVHDEPSFRSVLGGAGADGSAVCGLGFDGTDAALAPKVSIDGYCFWHSGTSSSCSEGGPSASASSRRLCLCL